MTAWYNTYWTTHPIIDENRIIQGGFYAAYLEEYSKWYR